MADILRFFTEFGSFGANYVKVVEDRSIQSATKMYSKESSSLERIIDRHLRDMHPLLDYEASESQSTLSV